MKKIKLFSALALTLVMASCDNFDLPNPPGQTNTDPEAYFADADLELAPVSEAISLVDAMDAGEDVTVANITKLENFPAEYSLEIDMEMGDGAEFKKVTTLKTSIAGDVIKLNPGVINGAIQEVISKTPGTYEVNARFAAYAAKGNTRMRLGGLDKYYLTEVLNIKTFNPDKVIEDMYYVVPCDAAGTPDWTSAVPMNNTFGQGASGYDHPEFSLKVESPEPDGLYFFIAPASVMTSKIPSQLFGGIPADTFGGKIVEGGVPVHIEMAGDILIKINVEEDSYELSYAFAALYPWNGRLTADNIMLLYTEDYVNYSGVCEITAQFVLGTSADETAAPQFKQDPTIEPEKSEDGLSQSGILSTSADAIKIPTTDKKKHLYWVGVNLPAMTYQLVQINNLGLVGAFNGWNEKENVEMTASKDFKTWTAADVDLDGEFKINANKAWAVGFSGKKVSDQNGVVVYNVNKQDGGANLSVENGKYDVKLDFSASPYTLTLTKKN